MNTLQHNIGTCINDWFTKLEQKLKKDNLITAPIPRCPDLSQFPINNVVKKSQLICDIISQVEIILTQYKEYLISIGIDEKKAHELISNIENIELDNESDFIKRKIETEERPIKKAKRLLLDPNSKEGLMKKLTSKTIFVA